MKSYNVFEDFCKTTNIQMNDSTSILAYVQYLLNQDAKATSLITKVSHINQVLKHNGTTVNLDEVYKLLNMRKAEDDLKQAGVFSRSDLDRAFEKLKDDTNRQHVMYSLYMILAVGRVQRHSGMDGLTFECFNLEDDSLIVTFEEQKRVVTKRDSKDKTKDVKFVVDADLKKCPIHAYKTYLAFLEFDSIEMTGKFWKGLPNSSNSFVNQNCGHNTLSKFGKEI